MTGVPASSRGLPTSGGTLTGPVAITSPNGANFGLVVKVTAAGTALSPFEVDDSSGFSILSVTADNTNEVASAVGVTGALTVTGTDPSGYVVTAKGPTGPYRLLVDAGGKIATAPPASEAATLALGTAYQHATDRDVLLVVFLSCTVNTSVVMQLGVGPTSTPTQQTIITGLTATGVWTVPIYLPASYYALLSKSGTGTVAIDGQIAMPV